MNKVTTLVVGFLFGTIILVAQGQWSSAPISLPTGTLIFSTSGTCPLGSTEATDIVDRVLVTTSIAGGLAGTTGGNDNITPAGTVSASTFTGDALSSHSHDVGTYANSSDSAGTPSGTNAWPAGVPTFAGSSSTVIVNHVHVQNVNTGTTGAQNGYGVDASTNGSGATGISTANPTGGAASYTPVGTIAWPAGVPAFTGSALSSHTHILSGSTASVSGGTPTGTNSTPTFTGSSFDNRQAFVKVIVCRIN